MHFRALANEFRGSCRKKALDCVGAAGNFCGSYVVGLTAIAVVVIAATVVSMSLKLAVSKE
jgi:hypothetical protein